MTGKIDQIEIITSIQRRRRRSAEEKTRIERTEFREFGDQGLSDGFSNTRHGRQQFSPFPPRRLIRACDPDQPVELGEFLLQGFAQPGDAAREAMIAERRAR